MKNLMLVVALLVSVFTVHSVMAVQEKKQSTKYNNKVITTVKTAINTNPDLASNIVKEAVELNLDLTCEIIQASVEVGADQDEMVTAALLGGADEEDLCIHTGANYTTPVLSTPTETGFGGGSGGGGNTASPN